MFHVLLLLACAVAIYVACEWFVNAVEWLGVRLEVGPVAVGTILAAAGTALPESVVTLVAVLFGSPEHGNDIAVGAAMGGPLVVGTIAYGVTGGMLIWRKRRQRAALTAAASPRGAWAAAPDGAGPDGSGPDRSGGLGGGSLALATDDRGDHLAGDDRPVTTWPASTRRGWPATRRGSSRSSRSRSGSAWSPSPSSRGSASSSSRSTPCTSGGR